MSSVLSIAVKSGGTASLLATIASSTRTSRGELSLHGIFSKTKNREDLRKIFSLPKSASSWVSLVHFT